MKVCVLTELQAHLLEHKGILPECCFLNRLRIRAGLPEVEDGKYGGHIHVEYREAVRCVGQDIGDGAARWVGGRFMIAYNTKRGWNRIHDSMQMTRETSGFRHHGRTRKPVYAIGGRERATSVRAINHVPEKSQARSVQAP